MNLRRGFALFFLVAATMAAQAHDARPNYVQITETDLNTFSVMWKVPASMPGGALPYPTLPEGCMADRQPAWQLTGAEYLGQQVFRCDAGLSGRLVGIEFPTINPSLSTLYKISLANGEEHLRILKPSETEWTVPDEENRFAVATEYRSPVVRGLSRVYRRHLAPPANYDYGIHRGAFDHACVVGTRCRSHPDAAGRSRNCVKRRVHGLGNSEGGRGFTDASLSDCRIDIIWFASRFWFRGCAS